MVFFRITGLFNRQNKYMAYEKVYAEMIVKFSISGQMRPMEIIWEDGKSYQIERVKKVERAPAKVGALIVKRYSVTIGGQERYLYFEETEKRWFVERKL